MTKVLEINNIDIRLAEPSNDRFEMDFHTTSSQEMTRQEFFNKLNKYGRIEDESLRNRNIKLLWESPLNNFL